GSDDSPVDITQDGTFDLSLAGNTDANGTSVVYQQQLNGGGWTNLASPNLVGLADGSYQFRAVVTDPPGNSSPTPAISVVVNNTAPVAGTVSFANLSDTGSDDSPVDITQDGTFDLSLAGNTDANGTSVVYQQQLNGGGWTNLASPNLVGLADGSYQFRAVVTDPAGNSSTTAAISVGVDNTAPVAGTVSFANLSDTGSDDSPVDITQDGTFDLSLAGNTEANGTSVVYQQQLNGGGGTNWASPNLVGLADGSYQFRAVVTDPAGNSSTTAAISVVGDNTAPVAGTVSFANLSDTGSDDSPVDITQDGTFDLSLAGNTDANGTSVVYQQQLNGGGWTNLASPNLVGLADGSYQFRAVVTDPAGNSSTTPAISVVVDNTAPVAGTLSFANLSDTGSDDSPVDITQDGTFDLSLAGNTDANGTSVVYQQQLNGGGWTNLASPNLVGLADGSYQFRAVVTDPAGNSSTTAAISVVVDNTAPVAGTLSFANLSDTGSDDSPVDITQDGT